MRFHIQTEDSGITRPHIITHLFADGGHVIKSLRTDYAELVDHPERAVMVHRMMREQHRAMALELRDGKLDATIDRLAPPAPEEDAAEGPSVEAAAASAAPRAAETAPAHAGIPAGAAATGEAPAATDASIRAPAASTARAEANGAIIASITVPKSDGEPARGNTLRPADFRAGAEAVPAPSSDSSADAPASSPDPASTQRSGEPQRSVPAGRRSATSPAPANRLASASNAGLSPVRRKSSVQRPAVSSQFASGEAPPHYRLVSSSMQRAVNNAVNNNDAASTPNRGASGAERVANSRPPGNRNSSNASAAGNASRQRSSSSQPAPGARAAAKTSSSRPPSSRPSKRRRPSGNPRAASVAASTPRASSASSSQRAALAVSSPGSSSKQRAAAGASSSSSQRPATSGSASGGERAPSNAISSRALDPLRSTLVGDWTAPPSTPMPSSAPASSHQGRPPATLPRSASGESIFGPLPQESSLDEAILSYVSHTKNDPPPRGSK